MTESILEILFDQKAMLADLGGEAFLDPLETTPSIASLHSSTWRTTTDEMDTKLVEEYGYTPERICEAFSAYRERFIIGRAEFVVKR